MYRPGPVIYEKLIAAAARDDAVLVFDTSGLLEMCPTPFISEVGKLSNVERKALARLRRRRDEPNQDVSTLTEFERVYFGARRLENEKQVFSLFNSSNHEFYITSEVAKELSHGARRYAQRSAWHCKVCAMSNEENPDAQADTFARENPHLAEILQGELECDAPYLCGEAEETYFGYETSFLEPSHINHDDTCALAEFDEMPLLVQGDIRTRLPYTDLAEHNAISSAYYEVAEQRTKFCQNARCLEHALVESCESAPFLDFLKRVQLPPKRKSTWVKESGQRVEEQSHSEHKMNDRVIVARTAALAEMSNQPVYLVAGDRDVRDLVSRATFLLSDPQRIKVVRPLRFRHDIEVYCGTKL